MNADLIGQIGEFLAEMLGGLGHAPPSPSGGAYREAQHPRVARGRPGAGQWTRKTALHYGPGSHPDGSPQSVHGGDADSAPGAPVDRAALTGRRDITFRGISRAQYETFRRGAALTSDGRNMTYGRKGDLHTTDNLAQAEAHARGGVLLVIRRNRTQAIRALRDIRRVAGDVIQRADVVLAYDVSTGRRLT